MKRVLLGAGVIALVLALYQNCALDSHHSGTSDLFSKSCQGSLKEAYRNTYYNAWFRSGDTTKNCIPCHASGGEAGPSREFANANFDKAFDVFMTIGRPRVENNGVNAGHKPPHTGPQNSGYVTSAKSTWEAAEAAAATCSGSTEITTSKKTAPANVYTTTPGDNAGTAWPKITWDLDTDLPQQQNQVHMTFSLEVRRFMDTSTPPKPIGYQFRNPTVTVKTVNGNTPTYQIEKITMTLNGAPYTYMTAYSLIEAVVNSTTGVNLAPNAAFAAAPTDSGTVDPSDEFALKFAAIKDGTGQPITNTGGGPTTGGGGIPTRVSFADLQSANGVFTRNCNSCHNANNRQGSLDITNYAAAVQAAPTIRGRMNNTANPMPPTGILSATDRGIVDVWVNGGTPQN